MKTMLLLILLSICSISRANELRADTMQDIFHAFDVEYFSVFQVKADLMLPIGMSSEYGQGPASLAITGAEPELALRIVRNPNMEIKFRHDSLAKSTAEGNQITSYDQIQCIMIELLEGRITRFLELSEVNTQDQIISRAVVNDVRQEVYPRNHDDLQNQVYRYLLPLGRGFGQCLDQVTSMSTKSDSAGFITIQAKGRLFSPYTGTWNLTVDPDHEYLVRSSVFTMDGHLRPDFRTSTSLNLTPDGALADGGWIDFDGYTIQVSHVNYQRDPDPELISICRSMKDHPPRDRGMRVFDFKQINSRGIPEMRVLPARSE